MTRGSLRVLFLVAAIGSAASVVLDLCSNQAMAASVIDLNTGTGGATYTLGYVQNPQTAALTDNAGVANYVATSNVVVANPTFASGGSPGQVVPQNIPTSVATGFGWISPGSNSFGTSSWIGPNSVGTAAGTSIDVTGYYGTNFTGQFSAPQGFYYYTTTFALTPSSAPYGFLATVWSSDNQGVAVFLNGINLNLTNPNQFFGSSTVTAPGADFNTGGAGLNTLTFVVWNENFQPLHSSPQGLDVVGSVTAVPEPSAIAVVVSGLPLMGLYWARRRRVSA
jgi:hypothetical protein